jgi:hypothetical protein
MHLVTVGSSKVRRSHIKIMRNHEVLTGCVTSIEHGVGIHNITAGSSKVRHSMAHVMQAAVMYSSVASVKQGAGIQRITPRNMRKDGRQRVPSLISGQLMYTWSPPNRYWAPGQQQPAKTQNSSALSPHT